MRKWKATKPTAIDEDNAKIIAEVFDAMAEVNNRLTHQMVAIQSICGWLIANRCMRQPNPLDAVQAISAMFLGTAYAIADNKADQLSVHVGQVRDTSGSTEAFERVGSIAEQTVRLMLAGQSGVR